MKSVLRRESADGVRLVLVHATDQIIGHAYVECPMFPACQDINVVHETTVRSHGFRAPHDSGDIGTELRLANGIALLAKLVNVDGHFHYCRTLSPHMANLAPE
jgi:hypothetical protein